MKVLVTGANGFLGSAVMRKLMAEGDEVTGLIRDEGASFDGSHRLVADLTSSASLEDTEAEFDAVVNCAGLAHQPVATAKKLFFDANVTGTRNIALFAARNNIKRFVHISSVSVYGNDGYEFKLDESAKCFPQGPYATSKLKSEEVCREVFAGTKTQLLILRPATVIGEGDRGNVFKLMKFFDSGFFLRIGKGENLKSFIYIEDLADAVYAVLNCDNLDHEVYNVTASPITVRHTVDVLSRELGKKIPGFSIPVSALQRMLSELRSVFPVERLRSLDESLRKWQKDEAIDGDRLSDIFKPKTSAEQALKREAEWFKNSK